MSYNTFSPIVTNGLVLYLDAANTKSYTGTGSVWQDLSSNTINGAINGTTYNQNSFNFDGNDFILFPSITDLQGNPTFTVCGWFKKNSDWNDGASWGIGGDGSYGSGINSWNYGSTNDITIDLWSLTTFTTNQKYSSTEWKYIVWTYNGSTFSTSNITIYVNSIPYTGSNLTVLRESPYNLPNVSNNGVVIGRAGSSVDLYYGKPIVSNFSIYNRVLSATEVLQNYNAHKNRFI